MRYLLPLLVCPFFLFPACGDKAAAAPSTTPAPTHVPAVGDAAKHTAALAKVTSTATELTKTLAGITDGATAEKAKASLESHTKTLGAELGDLGTMKSQAEAVLKPLLDKVNGLLANADIKKAIGPVLEQLKGLIPAK